MKRSKSIYLFSSKHRQLSSRCLVILMISVCFYSSYFSVQEVYADIGKYDRKYYSRFKNDDIEINVYNWGEYIANGSNNHRNLNKEFEELTGIKVNYSNYETNEAMYAKIKSNANSYDVIFPSDYMVARMIKNDMLAKLNFTNIPNFKYIDKKMLNPVYDKGNEYSVPYSWGMTALVYNKKFYDKKPDSWKALWDDDYKNQILMFKNSRDAFAIAQAVKGYDINTEDKEEIRDAYELLKNQKPKLQAYVMDQIFDKMQGEEAMIAPCYVGDAVLMQKENKNLEIAIPKETKNLFVDAMCIPKNSKHKEAAEMYINFLNEPDVAAANMEFILYSTPNLEAKKFLDKDIANNKYLYPRNEIIDTCESFTDLSDDTNAQIDKYWSHLLIPDNDNIAKIVLSAILISMTFFYLRLRNKRKRQD